MRYLITDDDRRILAALDVPPDEPVTVAIERADEPDLLCVSADLYADGSVHVGHWPDGQDWESVLRTSGALSQYGHVSPALPGPAAYTTDQIKAALTIARERTEVFTYDTDALDVLVVATLAHLANPGCNSPDPEEVTVRAVRNGYVSEFTALPGKTFGPWDMAEMIRDLTVSARLGKTAARDLVMEAASNGTATAETNC